MNPPLLKAFECHWFQNEVNFGEHDSTEFFIEKTAQMIILYRVKDSLHLHLFDEVTVDLVDANDDSETNSSQVHQRIEKKWLGSLSIPFSSLYKNTRIEGTFKLHSPPGMTTYLL